MSISTSPIRYSATTGGFYHAALHAGAIPDDAVPVTERRHRALLAGQGTGRAIIAGAAGTPELTTAPRVTIARQRELAVRSIKAEARRRILTIASLERQANDNAAIAMRDLMPATEAPDTTGFDAITAAIARRKAIDAIRAASNALETKIADWSAAALQKFNAADAAHWPGESPK